MTIHEVIDLFSHEMINEIYHSSADELSKDEFVNAVHEVASTVLKTYEAQTKRDKQHGSYSYCSKGNCHFGYCFFFFSDKLLRLLPDSVIVISYKSFKRKSPVSVTFHLFTSLLLSCFLGFYFHCISGSQEF